MVFQIKYTYVFAAVGGRFNHTWKVTAIFLITEEGEDLQIESVSDLTLGFDHGKIDFHTHGTGDIPKEILLDIIDAGHRAGAKAYADYKQRHEYELEY